MPRYIDYLVIGGGSTGTSIAYYISKLQEGRVALIEKDRVASGQTGRSTAIIRLHYSNPEMIKMALASYEVFVKFGEKVGGGCGFTRCGFAILVGEQDADNLKANVDLQRSLGVNTKLISPEELKDIEPRMRVDDVAAVAYEPDSGYADPVLTSLSFMKAAVDNGAEVMEGTEVTSLKVKGNSIEEVVTTSGTLNVGIVINATGVWTNRIADMLDQDLPIDIVREEIAVFHRPEEFKGYHMVIGDFINNYYMRPGGEVETYVGSLTPDLRVRERYPEELSRTEKIGYNTVEVYSKALARRFIQMRKAKYASGWVGLYDITPDWHPIISRDARVENVYHAVGLSGHGFKLAPAIGMMMAELVTKGRSNLCDSKLFDIARFREGRKVARRYKYGVVA